MPRRRSRSWRAQPAGAPRGRSPQARSSNLGTPFGKRFSPAASSSGGLTSASSSAGSWWAMNKFGCQARPERWLGQPPKRQHNRSNPKVLILIEYGVGRTSSVAPLSCTFSLRFEGVRRCFSLPQILASRSRKRRLPTGGVPQAGAPDLLGGKGNPKSVLSPSHESWPAVFSALTSTSTARQ